MDSTLLQLLFLVKNAIGMMQPDLSVPLAIQVGMPATNAQLIPTYHQVHVYHALQTVITVQVVLLALFALGVIL